MSAQSTNHLVNFTAAQYSFFPYEVAPPIPLPFLWGKTALKLSDKLTVNRLTNKREIYLLGDK